MMPVILVAVFAIGYFFIAMEHPLRIDKTASALLTGVVCWTILFLGQEAILPGLEGEPVDPHFLLDHALPEHLSTISAIVFFLLGAMTIVELIDAHGGFSVITSAIRTASKLKLVWILSILTFFLSAVLDNLTTTIVMTTLIRKLFSNKNDLWVMAGFVIIAANAGGAWSPIGDVTTIMLWIGGQVSTFHIIQATILPSMACILAPLAIVSFGLKGTIKRPADLATHGHGAVEVPPVKQRIILFLGVGLLLFVPIFKTITHLPPYMGMLLGLGVLWVVTELIHRDLEPEDKNALSVTTILRRIDTPSVLFFLGILLAVASLESAGLLRQLAFTLDKTLGNLYLINTLIGILSAVVDNVPLVAGAMAMYPVETYPPDHTFWTLLAYCAGTGGSALIIGSAAGVAAMGLLKIDFLWYMKRITWLSLVGYFAGILVYYLQHH